MPELKGVNVQTDEHILGLINNSRVDKAII